MLATLSRLTLTLSLTVAALVAQRHYPQPHPQARAPITDLHLVDYGTDLSVRDALISAGSFYGDLGRQGIARLDTPAAQAAVQDVTATLLGAIRPDEALVVSARTRSGAGSIHGRLLLARRAFFVTAAVPATLPQGCRSSGFHGGVQVFDLSEPYAPQRVPSLTAAASSASAAFASLGVPNPQITTMVAEVDQANISAHVQTLAAIFTRRATRPENAQAVAYVQGQLALLPNLTVTTESFSGNYGPNIIAEIPGTDLASEIVMIGAHIDSIAGSSGNRSPGADDNASGSAAVLEIARVLSTRQFRRTVRFGWWNAEEFGLVGSRAYAQNAAGSNEQIVAYINTDMNSYRAPGDSYSVDFVTNDSTPSLINALVNWTQTYVPTLQTNVGPLAAGTSDHRAFFENGFEAAFPFEDIGQYTPYIHTSNDDFGLSANDFTLSQLIARSVLAGLCELAQPLANQASFDAFAQGCAGTGSLPDTCTGINEGGGTLQGVTRAWEYAYQVSTAQPETLSSFEIFTSSTTGGSVTRNAYVYADAGGGPASTALASTTITIGPAGQFYTATLATPVAVSGTFYVSIDHSAQTTALSELTNGAAGVGFYRAPVTGAWTQSGLIDFPSVRLGCGGGQSNAIPAIGNVGPPLVDSSFEITLDAALGNSAALLVTGFSDSSWNGIPLPFAIPGAGACQLHASVDLPSATVLLDAAGRGTLTFDIPDQPSLVGGELFHQWAVFDPSANSFGFAFSGGAKSTIGG